MSYTYFSHKDRVAMERLLKQGFTPQQIAERLKVHHSKIYRELKRGQTENGYSAEKGQETFYAHIRSRGYGHDKKGHSEKSAD